MNRLPTAILRALESQVFITFLRFKEGGREQTHFVKIREGEGREALQGAYHVLDAAECRLCALAVSKFWVPAEPWAIGRALPLADEAGAVEALDEHFNPVMIVIHDRGMVASGGEG